MNGPPGPEPAVHHTVILPRSGRPAANAMKTPQPHDSPGRVERHVVLVAPEIHWNTGNIGRTCLAAGAFLHLVRPLGFSLEDRAVKRAGLDYWAEVKLAVWDRFEDFLQKMAPETGEVCLFSKTGPVAFWSMPTPARLFLVFGSETRGLPAGILRRYFGSVYHIPMTAQTRSLNLSTAVGIVLYHSLRDAPPAHAWQTAG
jgi:tRNA (cytidine/uridine-2'-O-)-methyltransferase